jgi:lipoate-protein ligase B
MKIMEFEVYDLGLVDFKESLEFQKRVFGQVKSGGLRSGLILCRHYPVITLGRRALKGNIKAREEELKNKDIQIFSVERGGDVTYHGPGQITAYPIFDLSHFKKDVHLFLRQLEQVVIDLLTNFGIEASRYKDATGVWVNKKKIASIGVAIKNWVTFHGLSINIKKQDLENFSLIRPCGMDIEMTSLETLLGRDIDTGEIKDSIIRGFEEVFNITTPCLL